MCRNLECTTLVAPEAIINAKNAVKLCQKQKGMIMRLQLTSRQSASIVSSLQLQVSFETTKNIANFGLNLANSAANCSLLKSLWIMLNSVAVAQRNAQIARGLFA